MLIFDCNNLQSLLFYNEELLTEKLLPLGLLADYALFELFVGRFIYRDSANRIGDVNYILYFYYNK